MNSQTPAVHQDGNALAGPLQEIFAVDVTAATGCCAGCGNSGPIAALRAYTRAPGLVARCPEFARRAGVSRAEIERIAQVSSRVGR